MEDEILLGLIPPNVKRNIEQLYVKGGGTEEEEEWLESYLSRLSLVPLKPLT